MTPERAGPHLALMGIGLLALLTRGCVSDALASDPIQAAAERATYTAIGETGQMLGSGLTGAVLAMAVLLLVLHRLDLLPAKKQPHPRAERGDDEREGTRPHWVSREEARVIARDLVAVAQAEAHAAHDRVRAELAKHEAKMIKMDDRIDGNRRETAEAVSKITEALSSARASLHELRGRMSTATLRED
jgi:hypothetical protein